MLLRRQMEKPKRRLKLKPLTKSYCLWTVYEAGEVTFEQATCATCFSIKALPNQCLQQQTKIIMICSLNLPMQQN
jgi:hypothetical protein